MLAHRIARISIALACSLDRAAIAASYAYDPAPKLSVRATDAVAGEYRLELAHSSVTMKLSHMGLSFYTIRFNEIAGHLRYDPAHPTSSQIEVSLNPASIDTGNAIFDKTIASKYFESQKYPVITFPSTAIHAAGRHGTVSGVLDMHGVKKPIVLHVTYHGFDGSEKPERMGFSATTSLKRSDFGLDAYVPAQGDRVDVSIETEFRRSPGS